MRPPRPNPSPPLFRAAFFEISGIRGKTVSDAIDQVTDSVVVNGTFYPFRGDVGHARKFRKVKVSFSSYLCCPATITLLEVYTSYRRVCTSSRKPPVGAAFVRFQSIQLLERISDAEIYKVANFCRWVGVQELRFYALYDSQLMKLALS